MSQNPWKKQAEANKAQPPKPGGTGAPPPWMKKADQPASQPAQTASQPAQSSTPQQSSATTTPVQQSPVPAFKPPAQNPSAGGGAPWMKPGGSQPVPPKPPGSTPATSGNVPAWMKNKPGASPAQSDVKAEEDKAEEERLRKQKQQQQERKRKQEEQRIQRQKQAQQRAKQEQAKRKKGSKKSSPVKSAKQPCDIPTFTTPFHKYLSSINLALAKEQSYADKIQNQKLLVECLAKFTESCSEGLQKYLNQRRITQRKKNIINLQNIYVEYAMVEGVSGDPVNAYFRTKIIEHLQQKHRHYQVLFHLVVKLIRKSSNFRLRAPLLSRVSWKGIQFLCEGVCDDLLDSVPVPAQNFLQIHAQLTQLQKQLKQVGYDYLNKKTLLLKKINIQKDELFVMYLPDNFETFIPKQVSANKLAFAPYLTPTCESVSNLSLLASHRLNLSYGSMRDFNNLKRNSTQIFIQTYLNLFQLAHAIRIVYASCQGELQELSFWTLVFDGNTNIWTLVKKAYQGLYGEIKQAFSVQLRNRFALAKIIEQLAPVQFGIGKKHTSYEKIPVYVQSKPILHCYPLQSIELYEISSLLNKTLDNPSKIKISEDSLGYQQILLTIANELYVRKVLAFNNKLTIMLQKGQLHEDKQIIKAAITQAEIYELQISKGREMEQVIILPTLMSLYMAASKMGIDVAVSQQSNSESKSNSDRFNNSKLEESEVEQVRNSEQMKELQEFKTKKQELQSEDKNKDKGVEVVSSQKKSIKQSPKKKRIHYSDYEEALLKVFSELLKYIELLFEDEKQVWIHASLYMILASYYSRPVSNQQKQKQKQKQKMHITKEFEEADKSVKKQSGYFNSQKLLKLNSSPSIIKVKDANIDAQESQTIENEIAQPYKKQCMKFVQLGHDIQMKFYGAQSPQMAQFLYNQSQIYYNIKQYKKAENSINEALKIFKSSSKHAKFALNGTIIYGKAMFQQGKIQKDAKLVERSIQILQKTVQQLISLSMDKQIIQVYEFLCANMDYVKNGTGSTKIKWQGDGFYQIKIEEYLQKMSEISFSTHNYEFLKKVIKKIVINETNLYSKETALTLKDMYTKYFKQNDLGEQTENDKIKRQAQSIDFLEEQKVNFGGLVDLIKWSFGIIKVKNQSSEFDKATQVMQTVLGLFSEKQVLQMLSL